MLYLVTLKSFRPFGPKAPTMFDSASTIAGVAVIVLSLGIAAGTSPLGRRQLRQLDGNKVRDERYIKLSAYLLMAAVALGGIAATIAISGLFST